MTTPKKPAKRTTGRVTASKRSQLAVTSVSDWKSGKHLPIELPSGKVARLHNPGIRAFLEGGLIPNALIPIVTEALEKGKSPSKSLSNDMMKRIQGDLGLLSDILVMMDAICVNCFIEPEVHPVPAKASDCQVDLLYVDELDAVDKSFVMNWAVGGTADLKKFREQLAGNMGAF